MKIVVATAVVVAVVFPVVWQEYAIARTRLENRDLAADEGQPLNIPAGATLVQAIYGNLRSEQRQPPP